MGWWADRRERKRKEREQADKWQQDRLEKWYADVELHDAQIARARGKAEQAAENGDGNSALAWLKIAEELQKHRFSFQTTITHRSPCA